MTPLRALTILEKVAPVTAVVFQKFLHKELIPALHELEEEEPVPRAFWQRPSFQIHRHSYQELVVAMLRLSDELSPQESSLLQELVIEMAQS